MVWPPRHGSAASGSEIFVPPREGEFSVMGGGPRTGAPSGLDTSKVNRIPTWSKTPVYRWADVPRELRLYGYFSSPPELDGTDSDYLSLGQVRWPPEQDYNSGFGLNRMEIRSRPVGAATWRSNVAIARFDEAANLEKGFPYGGYVFATNQADEYQARAFYADDPLQAEHRTRTWRASEIPPGRYYAGFSTASAPMTAEGGTQVTVLPYQLNIELRYFAYEDRVDAGDLSRTTSLLPVTVDTFFQSITINPNSYEDRVDATDLSRVTGSLDPTVSEYFQSRS